jgi:hypothetical protein
LDGGCRANPPWREFVVDNSNDPWGDAAGRTEESQVATRSTTAPEPSLDFSPTPLDCPTATMRSRLFARSALEISRPDVCRLTVSGVCRAFGRRRGPQRLMQALCVGCEPVLLGSSPMPWADTLAPPRKAGASSTPARTTACRPRRASRQRSTRARCFTNAGVVCPGAQQRDGITDRVGDPTRCRGAYLAAPGVVLACGATTSREIRGERRGARPMRVLNRAHIRERAFSDLSPDADGQVGSLRVTTRPRRGFPFAHTSVASG